MSSQVSNPQTDKVTFQITVNQLKLSKHLSRNDIRVSICISEWSKITCSGKKPLFHQTIIWNHPFLFSASPSTDVVIAIWTLPKKLSPTWDKYPVGEKMVTNVASLLDSANEWKCNVPGLHDGLTVLSMTCRPSEKLTVPEDHHCISALSKLDMKIDQFSRRFKNMSCILTQIEVGHALLDLCPEGHKFHITMLNNLVASYTASYNTGGRLCDINRAIELAEKRLHLCPKGHPEHSRALGDLGLSLYKLYQVQGNQAGSNRLIEMQQTRLDLCPVGHWQHPYALRDLALSLRLQYDAQGNMADLDRAIEIGQQRLDLCPPGNPEHGEALGNLSIDLNMRYKKQGKVDDLNKCIELAEKQLKICPHGHPYHGHSLICLGSSLSVLYDLQKSTSDGLKAVDLLKQALGVYPVQHQDFPLVVNTLASAIININTHSSSGSNPLFPTIEDAFETYKRLVKIPGSAASFHLWNAAKSWVNNAEKYSHPSELEAYQTSLNILDHYTSLRTSLDSRHQVLQARVADLANNAFSCAVRHGDLQKAVECLEQGRGILWNQLARFDISLAALEARGGNHQGLSNSFAQLSASLRNITQGAGASEMEPYWRVHEEWVSVVDEIRRQDGFSRFLLPPCFADLQHAAEHGPVIIVNASDHGCDALIVLSDRSPVHVPLEYCSLESVVRLCTRFSELIQDPHAYASGPGDNRDCWLRSMLCELWENVVEPIVDVLQNDIQLPQHSRIWWCPTSHFTVLPFHAAGPHRAKGNQPNLVDIYVSSYTPSLSCLIRTRERARSQKAAHLQVASGATNTVSFAAVGQSTPHADLELSTLPFVDHEVARIRDETNMSLNRVTFETVTGKAATIEGAVKAFKNYRWIHLACHGAQHAEKPFESWFAMGDGKLTLMRIIQERYAHSEFAFLSACHTAQGDRSTPDEVLHLAAGMQFAGFNGVIGTLWKVDDEVAHQVVTRFYQKMFEQPVLDSEYAATAFNFAVRHSPEVPLEKRIVFAHIGI